MYKVFINERPLVLSAAPIVMHQGQSFPYQNTEQLKALVADLKAARINHNGINVYSADLQQLWAGFCSLFNIIEAAGGIVINPDGKYLFIQRLGYWDLPKGKIDRGETIEQAAVREVEEECGIDGLNITAPAGQTYHTYEHKGWDVLKVTHWFAMHSNFTGTLVPQTEEGISEVRWLSKADIEQMVLPKTYVSIAELVRNWIL